MSQTHEWQYRLGFSFRDDCPAWFREVVDRANARYERCAVDYVWWVASEAVRYFGSYGALPNTTPTSLAKDFAYTLIDDNWSDQVQWLKDHYSVAEREDQNEIKYRTISERIEILQWRSLYFVAREIFQVMYQHGSGNHTEETITCTI